MIRSRIRILSRDLIIRTVAILALVGIVPSPAAGEVQSGPLLRLKAGVGQGVISVNQYPGDPAFPDGNTVRVVQGTTIAWTLGSDEPHTVTFRAGAPWPLVIMPQPEDQGRPPMYNPRLVVPTIPTGPWDGTSFIHMELDDPHQELRVTFASPGKYRYSCLLHEEMDGYVEVVAQGATGVTTQAAVDDYASTLFAKEHADDAQKIVATRSDPARLDGPASTSLWFVRAGTNDRRGNMDINAFLPGRVTVSAGDTVVWYVDHDQPHTVTFAPLGGPRPELVAEQLPDGQMLPAPEPGQAPSADLTARLQDPTAASRLVLPGAIAARPSAIYDGTSLYNSGLIGEQVLISYPMQKTWALTFETPGSFDYTCLVHDELGMKGTITVVPRE